MHGRLERKVLWAAGHPILERFPDVLRLFAIESLGNHLDLDHIPWRKPDLLGKMMSLLLPQIEDPSRAQEQQEMIRRLAEALHQDRGSHPQAPEEEREDVEIDATMTFSEREIRRTMDFEAMSREETARAEAAIRRLRLPLNEVPIRRWEPDPRGLRADMRATLRAAIRAQDLVLLKRRARSCCSTSASPVTSTTRAASQITR